MTNSDHAQPDNGPANASAAPVNEAPSDSAAIRELNDRFRTTMSDGRLVLTRGIIDLGAVDTLIALVSAFTDFNEDNDPHHEHDFGSFDFGGETVYWKIDYYDADMQFGSPNAADPRLTTRVLTILLASEY